MQASGKAHIPCLLEALVPLQLKEANDGEHETSQGVDGQPAPGRLG